MAEKKVVDWEAVERDYRAGIKTLRQIGDEYGVSNPAIVKRAKRDGWERDLTKKIHAKAESLVSKQLVSKEVSKETAISERQIIDVNAQAIVNVRLSHRSDLGRGRGIVNAMLEELSMQCGSENAELLAQLGEMMRSPDDFGQDKLNDLYHKVISLPGRAKTMKDLAESLSKLIDKERQAFGLDKDATGEDKAATLTDAQRASRLAALIEKAKKAAVNA